MAPSLTKKTNHNKAPQAKATKTQKGVKVKTTAVKSAVAPPPPKKVVRKTPGPLLETARRSQSDNPELADAIARSSSGGATAATKELVFDIVDYFDAGTSATDSYAQWQWDVSQTLVGTAEVGINPTARIVSAKLYALSKFNTDTTKGAYGIVSTTPANIFSASDEADSDQAISANPRTTVITPAADTKWVLVGSWKASKLFGDSQITPAVSLNGGQAVFSFVVIDPDTAKPFATAFPVQMKICVRVAQGLAPLNNARFALVETAESSMLSEVVDDDLATQLAYVSIVGMSDYT